MAGLLGVSSGPPSGLVSLGPPSPSTSIPQELRLVDANDFPKLRRSAVSPSPAPDAPFLSSLTSVGLVETKVAERNSLTVSSRIRPNWSWFMNYSACSSGRIWVGWDPNLVSCIILASEDQVVHLEVLFLEKNIRCILSFIYGANSEISRRLLWDSLRTLSNHPGDLPWPALGDFNAIRSPSEALGGIWHNKSSIEFDNCLRDCDLADVCHEGMHYTWNDGRDSSLRIFRKLDRVVANGHWLDSFRRAKALFPPARLSDHSPCILLPDVVNYITKKIWKRFELQHVACNESGFYFFRFSSGSMLEKCLANGPWMIAGHPFFLKKWWPGMILAREEHKSFPTWISMSGIPVEYWTPLGLSWIASAIGKPLFLDPVTEKLERLGFARVCVELGVNAPRPNSVKIRTKGSPGELKEHLCDIKIEYQHRPARKDAPEKSRVKSKPKKASWVPKQGVPSRVVSSPSGLPKPSPRLKYNAAAAAPPIDIVPKAITTSNSFMALQEDNTNDLSECPTPNSSAQPIGFDHDPPPGLNGPAPDPVLGVAPAEPAILNAPEGVGPSCLRSHSPPPPGLLVQFVVWSLMVKSLRGLMGPPMIQACLRLLFLVPRSHLTH